MQAQQARKYLIAAIAFVLQGAWAWYVNQPFGLQPALKAALLHGCLSAAQTLVSAVMMEFFFALARVTWLKLVLPVLGTLLVMVLLMGSLHWINRTPDIARTLLPLLFLGLPYYAIYTGVLWRTSNKTG